MASKNYSVEMMWSEDDGVYLAQVRELPGCVADGETLEEAFQNIVTVKNEWLETAAEEGREIPEPLTVNLLARNAQMAHEQLQTQIGNRIREAVGQILENVESQQSQNISPTHPRLSMSFDPKSVTKSR